MSYTNIISSSFASSSQDHSLDPEFPQSGFPLNEEDHVLIQTSLNVPSFTPADIYGQQQYYNACYQQQHALSSMLPDQAPQPEYFGHNLGCAPYPCYGGMMGAYGPPMAQPQYVDVPPRILLVPETGPQPVFVNPKQYEAILRRRATRAKEENEKKLIKKRKPYIHESRHLHAKNRPRGTGGRFSKKGEVDSSNTAASSSSRRVQPKPFETPRQSNHESPSYHFLSLDLGDEYLNISSPNQG